MHAVLMTQYHRHYTFIDHTSVNFTTIKNTLYCVHLQVQRINALTPTNHLNRVRDTNSLCGYVERKKSRHKYSTSGTTAHIPILTALALLSDGCSVKLDHFQRCWSSVPLLRSFDINKGDYFQS